MVGWVVVGWGWGGWVGGGWGGGGAGGRGGARTALSASFDAKFASPGWGKITRLFGHLNDSLLASPHATLSFTVF